MKKIEDRIATVESDLAGLKAELTEPKRDWTPEMGEKRLLLDSDGSIIHISYGNYNSENAFGQHRIFPNTAVGRLYAEAARDIERALVRPTGPPPFEYGDRYWYITAGGIVLSNPWHSDDFDWFGWAHGRVFET